MIAWMPAAMDSRVYKVFIDGSICTIIKCSSRLLATAKKHAKTFVIQRLGYLLDLVGQRTQYLRL
jgi:hypothetical protein